MKLVIVTGMSGAGKTIALKMLEDMGFYCVDNLPISLVDKFAQLAAAGSDISQAALGIDIRSGEELNQLDAVLRGWRELGMDYQILFLDANDGVLIKRYKETRRSHPLAGTGRLDKGIEKERVKLAFSKRTRISSLTPASSLPGSCGRSWKRYSSNTRSTATCLSRFFPLALSTAFRRMRTWFSTCVFCPIPTIRRTCAC